MISGENETLAMQRRIGAVVLCGGESRRMGRPKWSLPFGDETSLARVVRIVSAVASPVVVVGYPEMERPILSEQTLFVRDQTPFQGPLSGFATGLEALKNQADAAFLLGCDSPMIRSDLLRFLMTQLQVNSEVVVVHQADRLQPLGALYQLSVTRQVTSLLESGERSLQALLKHCERRIICESDLADVDPGLQSFLNMNTVDDYHRLLELAGLRHSS
ncbi:molybdenum cofactor guanylyltransferase [Planctomicrobium sp. SH668]|uniref:molybdenum cofactor guanylyltransferase n=1 Tax=Planctomicrobium sp. SH668 TaxID=3448126 RepID=UPI003F5B6125